MASSQPYLRAADDGTYEVVVPAGMGRDHILPYCFHTEEDALRWLSTRKGREQIRQIGLRVQTQYQVGGIEHAHS